MNPSPLTPKTPEQALAGLLRRVPKEIRLTFLSAVILGFVTHMYMFVNKLPNHDDINHLFSADYGTASGRWLLPTILSLDGPFSLPWVIGTLSVLCLAGTACLTVSLLRIRRPLGCVITAGLIVSFPAVTATFTYMFTADAYFFSLMLAAFGAYAAVRLRWGVPLGAVAIILSMGIYQSYFGVAAVLMVGALLLETLDGQRPFRELFFRGIRLAGTLAAAIAVYLVIIKITSRLVPLTDYMGISEMGHISLSQLPAMIAKSYYRYFTFYLKNDSTVHFGFLKYAFILAVLACLILGVLLARTHHAGPARSVLAVALTAVYPLAGNLIYVMAPYVHDLMIYGLLFILILPIALADRIEDSALSIPAQWVQAAASWVILLTMALTAYSYMLTANAAYLKMDLCIQQATAYSNRLLTRIESCEGYRQGMPVVLVGSHLREATLNVTPQLDDIRLIGVFNLGELRTCYTYGQFLRYYLGFTEKIYPGDSVQAQEFFEMDQVKAMPLYPEEGSIQVINDMVVVRLNDLSLE